MSPTWPALPVLWTESEGGEGASGGVLGWSMRQKLVLSKEPGGVEQVLPWHYVEFFDQCVTTSGQVEPFLPGSGGSARAARGKMPRGNRRRVEKNIKGAHFL